MGRTFGEIFEDDYDADTKRRLMLRFKVVAKSLATRHRYYDSTEDDLVQEAFRSMIPNEYDIGAEGGPLTLVWTIIERKIFSSKRKHRPTFEHELPKSRFDEHSDAEETEIELDAPQQGPDAVDQLIHRETLRAFIIQTEQMVFEFETILGCRRRDFRKRVKALFDVFCADPDKYFDPPNPASRSVTGVRVRELAADLGWSENTYQQFKARVDSILIASGLSLERLFLGIFVHEEAVRIGIVQKPLRIG